jgi:type I restriction enzyme S subunit
VEKNLNNAKELFQSQLNQIFSQKGDGWEEKKLGEVFTIRPKKNEAKVILSDEDMVTFLPMADLKELEKEINPQQQKQLNQVYSGYTYFAENDVLLAKITPCFENGKLGIAKNLVNGIGFGSSEYIVFRYKSEIIPEYLFYYLSRDYFRIEGGNAMMGAVGHKRVAKEFIENYLISYPKDNFQKKIVNQLDDLKAQTQSLESNYQQELDALDELKKSILQKAFNGEL